MKIIISPSKSKKLNNKNKEHKNIFFEKITKEIINEICKLNINEIEKKFKLKSEQAEKLHKFYKNYENEKEGDAILSYSGIAYKSIMVNSFSDEELLYLENNLVIFSALYGLLTPFTKIKEYRLDMVNSIFENKSLYEIWKKEINKYFENEEIIINLASKEYSKILSNKNIYDFEFYNEIDGKLKQISTNSKKMRGFTVNYIVKNKIQRVEELKNITLDGYEYNEDMSEKQKYVYIKIDK